MGYMSDEVFRATGKRLKNMDQINKTDISDIISYIPEKINPITQSVAFISIMIILSCKICFCDIPYL